MKSSKITMKPLVIEVTELWSTNQRARRASGSSPTNRASDCA
jgi:hypothetical protein